MENFYDRLMLELAPLGVSNINQLSRELGYSRADKLYRLEKDRTARPSFEVIQDITKKFVTIDLKYLLTGERSLDYKENEKTILRNLAEPRMPYVISTDNQGKENILLVPHYAQAGYANGYNDPEYLETLPSYRLPKIDNGTFRMFEVKGHSMTPTLHDGAMAVGEWCESLDDIKDDMVYIIVTKNDGIVIKRAINRIKKYGNLYLKSDNRSEFPAFTMQPDEINEIWKWKGAFIFSIPNPADIYDRITDLEAEMLHIKSTFSK